MHNKTLTGAAALLALTLLATACSEGAKDTHPDQPVTKRKAVFKQFTGALEPLGLMARERKPYDAAAFKAGTVELQRLSTLPWAHFTADSNYPPTRAKPAVWDKPADFKQAQADYATALTGLAAAAETGTLEAGRSAVDAVQKACKACHDTFRSDAPGG